MGKVVSFESHRKRVKKQVIYKNTVDYTLVVALVLLIALGLLMVFSSSFYAAEFRASSSGDAIHFFVKQLICVGIGLGLMLVFTFVFDYHYFTEVPYEKHRWLKPLRKIPLYWLILIASLAAIALVWVPGLGVEINGSRRWIDIGISFQPSELLKMGVIIFMACSIGRAPRKMDSFKSGVLYYLVMLLIICIPIYLQPNFSAILCITALVFIMLWVGGANWKHLLIIIGIGAVALYFLAFMREYRANRISALTDPLEDWQLKQSLFAVGTGGLFGKGVGNSLQKMLWLPMSESDFIFAIIAEEMGFIGAIAVLIIYGVIIWRGVVIAMRAPDLTGMLLCTGSVGILAVQVIINVAVVIGIVPTTGIVLPFISYGGSSVIVFMMLMGIILNVSRQCQKPVPTKTEHEKGDNKRRKRKQEQPKQPKNRSRVPVDSWDI